ncbi:hypothetical protein [Proteus vulgaris]|uniref:hypothetical protein n=1 Tax=Proteus vulgaris TaxID=585 RepID=UPI000F4E1FB6|nr:hypothetical protein [Proteus vulgaris]AYY80275.1 hypothetical protein EGX81_05075 [Proteus vulgaris]
MTNDLDAHIDSNVWYFGKFDTWKDVILHLINDVVNQDVLTAFQTRTPENFSLENFEWLSTLVYRINGSTADIPKLLEERLYQYYRAIRAYHGTRTESISSFYVKGLLTLNPDEAKESVKNIFLSERFPEVTDTMLTEAFNYIDLNLTPRENTIYFFTNHKMHFSERSKHYILFGSEYILSIICRLEEITSKDYRTILQEIGYPTIISCDIPLKLIPPETLTNLIKQALYDVFSSLLGSDYNYSRGFQNLYIKGNLPAKCIVKCHIISI